MVAFPKLLYLLQTLPLLLYQSDINILNKTFRRFIWGNGGRSRIGLYKLQMLKREGGVNFPDIGRYNVAANFRYIIDWLRGSSHFANVQLEQQLYPHISLMAMIHLSNKDLPNDIRDQPILWQTILTWRRGRKMCKLKSGISPFQPFLHNPQFVGGRPHKDYTALAQQKCTMVVDILDQHFSMLSFDDVIHRFPFFRHRPFLFLQARSLAQKFVNNGQEANQGNKLDSFLRVTRTQITSTSRIYSVLRREWSWEGKDTGPARWAKDIGGVEVEDFLNATIAQRKIIPYSSYTDMALLILHRAYITPYVQSKMTPTNPYKCSKCGIHNTDIFHHMWGCDKIQALWRSIHAELQLKYKFKFPLTPQWAIFNILEESQQMVPKHVKAMLVIWASAVRKSILHQWLNPTAPPKSLILSKILFLFKMDWLDTLTNKEKLTGKFFTTWSLFIPTLDIEIKNRLKAQFGNTQWYLLQCISGRTPIP